MIKAKDLNNLIHEIEERREDLELRIIDLCYGAGVSASAYHNYKVESQDMTIKVAIRLLKQLEKENITDGE